MFESQCLGLARIGAEESHLDGAQVVIGVADGFGNVLGWFGRNYHPNEEVADEVGAEDYAPDGGLQLVLGIADAEEEHIIGWSIGKFLKKVTKAVAAPITAPIKATVAIAKGQNVVKSLAKSVTQPIKAQVSLARATVAPVVRTASAVARPLVGKKIAAGLTNVSLSPFNVAQKVVTQAGKGQVLQAVKTSIVDPLKSGKALAAPVLKAASPIIKSNITAGIVSGVALAFPPIGVPLAAGYAAARVALPYAATALGAADKVLAAAKGTLPSMLQAPPVVAQALQTAAKFTIAKTYQAATLGSQDAQRALAVLTTAKKVQMAIPAAQAAIHPVASIPTGAVQQAPLVQKSGDVIRGHWQKMASGGTHDGPIVLTDGTVIKGSWKLVG